MNNLTDNDRQSFNNHKKTICQINIQPYRIRIRKLSL